MKVILAGYNLDSEVIEALKRGETGRSDVTPEVLSASYARISRDPRSIDELRAEARKEVEKSRKSNQSIIFKMGHHSVAEHAVFNFDIIGTTRLSFEDIEKFRLCSYTEKSQRYQKLEDNYLVPEEIKGTGLEKPFINTINAQNKLYQEMVSKEVPPEDARYITSLATLGQVGMTLNARNLELLFRRFASSPLHEIRELGKKMHDEAKAIAPSIILFTDPTPLDRDTYPSLKETTKKLSDLATQKHSNTATQRHSDIVSLVEADKNADLKTIAAILHTSTSLPYKKCKKLAKEMQDKEKLELIKASMKNMEFFDANIREYEYADMTFEVIVSAACFGQLKRHRTATLTSQEYNPKLGITIPQTVIDKGFEKEFIETAKQSEKAFNKIYEVNSSAAPYILTNAHRKRVLFKCNARELYHISRLREDKHAQWDIQNISRQMSALAKEAMPYTMLTIGGKDIYPEIYEKVFGIKPKVMPIY